MAKDRDEATNPHSDQGSPESSRRTMSPAAQRALAEAEARRREREAQAATAPREVNGRAGPDPVRYGDWENKGIASDF